MLFKVLQDDLAVWSLPGLYPGEVLQVFGGLFSKQVVAIALIYLNVTDGDLNLFLFQSFLLEHISQRPGNETAIIKALSPTGHRKSFTRPGLSICKYRSIIAIDCRINHVFGDFIEDLLLFGIHIEHLVEGKYSFFLLIVDVAFVGILCDKELDFGLLTVYLKPLENLFGGADS
jgi:hypothetical protein